jgi:type VI secretion system secreted protein Hcp
MDVRDSGIKPVTGVSAGTRAATYSMKVEGQKQGWIKGDITKTWKGAADEIELMSWQHGLTSPRDAHTGLPTGRRMHQPIEVVGKLSKAAPLLFFALCTNEMLKKVTINCWSQAKAGAGATVAIFYTVELENANIAQMQHVTHDVDGSLFYRVSFTYEKITFTWKDGGITAEDTWELTVK